MSDGKSSHAGLQRTSMKAILEALQTDPVLIEKKVEVTYALDHPSKQIVGSVPKFRLRLEPAGFSQTTGAGVLDLQYWTWISLIYKPVLRSHDEEDDLTYLCEYITDLLHKKMWGGMSTYVNKVITSFQSYKLQTNNREIEITLAHDEIGAIISLWQSPKTISEIGNGEGYV